MLPVIALLLAIWTPDTSGQSAWPTHHRDFRNSDYTPFPTTADLEVAWTALDGYAIITAPTIGRDGTLYVTTGKESSGNLHAISRYGRLLWTHPEIDSKAITSSPLVDEQGVIYVTDRDQIWAVNPDGSTRWRNLVPAPFGTAFLIGSNSVGGITLNGHVLLFDRTRGVLNAIPIKLPGSAPSIPTNLLEVWEGMIDPAIIDTVIAGLLGYGSLVANTPAIHPDGNLVIIATGDGFLYGIRMQPGDISIKYQVPIGKGSGTSPAISPDGRHVYICDGDGYLSCHDPFNGQVQYRMFTGKTFASPSIDEQGTVYVGGGGVIQAIRKGKTIWRNDLDSLARSRIEPIIYNGGVVTARCQPTSVLSVSPRHIYVQVDMGHPFDVIGGGQITSPRWTGMIVLNRSNGRLAVPPIRLRDTGGAVVTLNADGRAYAPHGSITTSMANQLMNPVLPPARRFPDPPGGITALRPRDPDSLFREQMATALVWHAQRRPETAILLKAANHTLADAVMKGQRSIDEALRISAWLNGMAAQAASF